MSIKKAKKKKSKKHKKEPKKKKRVNFPWVKRRQTKVLKYFLAYRLDKLGFDPVIRGKLSLRKYFNKKVLPKVREKFPSVYSVIKKYYEKNGRTLSKAEYENLLFLRIQAMFHYKKGDKKVRKKKEHPDKTTKKSKKCAGLAQLLMKKGKTYESVV